MRARNWIVGGTVLLGSVAALAQAGGSPADRWQQVVACAAQGSNAARHDCIDAVLRAAGALSPEREAQVNRENFGREDRQAPSSAPAPSPALMPPATAAAAPQPAPIAPPQPLQGIATQVAAVSQGGDRKIVVTTTEGAVWRQIDSSPIRRLPRVGESFEVREGAMGGYRCTFNGNTTYRCERRD
jgi:hypothetical protein